MVDSKELTEGMSLGGVYTLEQSMRHDATGTFFAASTKNGKRVQIKPLPAESPDAEQQFARWQRLRQLRHTNLLELRDAGRGEAAGNRYVYAAFEYPDDVLSAGLKHGPLTEAETRSVLEAALAALRHLHGNGFVHGAVTPEQIVAVGETVKLATDGVRESNSPEEQADDVRQLGELVRLLREPEALSEPLATIARRATAKEMRKRWTLSEIGNALAPPPPAPPPVPRGPVAAPAPVRRSEADPPQPERFPKWIFAGVAVLLLGVLAFNLRPKADAPAATRPVPAVAEAERAAPTPAEPAAAAPVAPAPVTTPAPVATPPATKAPEPATAVWRVVAFTYRSREMAEKKAKEINGRWPDLHAAAFEPKGLRGYYLVALGDRMERGEAVRLQQKARGMGLPRDTYVQNYSE
jgi:eukaryotic-like serine/threonine-protein kinase